MSTDLLTLILLKTRTGYFSDKYWTLIYDLIAVVAVVISEDDEILPFYNYYMQAEENVDSLMQIRWEV